MKYYTIGVLITLKSICASKDNEDKAPQLSKQALQLAINECDVNNKSNPTIQELITGLIKDNAHKGGDENLKKETASEIVIALFTDINKFLSGCLENAPKDDDIVVIELKELGNALIMGSFIRKVEDANANVEGFDMTLEQISNFIKLIEQKMSAFHARSAPNPEN